MAWAALIPAAASLIGGFLSKGAQNSQDKQTAANQFAQDQATYSSRLAQCEQDKRMKTASINAADSMRGSYKSNVSDAAYAQAKQTKLSTIADRDCVAEAKSPVMNQTGAGSTQGLFGGIANAIGSGYQSSTSANPATACASKGDTWNFAQQKCLFGTDSSSGPV
jgi:hypothetical protein